MEKITKGHRRLGDREKYWFVRIAQALRRLFRRVAPPKPEEPPILDERISFDQSKGERVQSDQPHPTQPTPVFVVPAPEAAEPPLHALAKSFPIRHEPGSVDDNGSETGRCDGDTGSGVASEPKQGDNRKRIELSEVVEPGGTATSIPESERTVLVVPSAEDTLALGDQDPHRDVESALGQGTDDVDDASQSEVVQGLIVTRSTAQPSAETLDSEHHGVAAAPPPVPLMSAVNPDNSGTDKQDSDALIEGQATVAGSELEIPTSQEFEIATDVPSRRGLRVAPEKRGGKPRESAAGDQVPKSEVGKRNKKTQQQRPELVCWLQGMCWVVGVEVPEELRDPSVQVWQPPNVALEEEGSRDRRWRLKQPLESVLIAPEPHEGRAIPAEILAAQYRIFKVVGIHGTHGRAVRQGSAGRFLVIVPESWRWNEDLSGPASAAADSVFPGTCQAHHVELPLAAGRVLAFNTPEGDCVRIPCAGHRVELVGVRINDASEQAGPLFVREPPQLQWGAGIPIPEDAAISTVVVGEEGATVGRRRWRVHSDRFEALLPAIANRRVGWFFVRLYDSSDELIESLDFRFVADLEAIEVEGASAIPGPEGHLPALIHVRHQKQCFVRGQAADSPTVESLPHGCRMVVPPDTRYDETRWLVGPIDGSHVEMAILIERVWWAHLRDGAERNELQWTDRPLKLSRDDFKATSGALLALRLPRAGWANEVRIGFESTRSRSIHISASERECLIPLCELEGSREVAERAAASLRVWISPARRAGQRLESEVGLLPASETSLVQSYA
jgi:hypothetical protein